MLSADATNQCELSVGATLETDPHRQLGSSTVQFAPPSVVASNQGPGAGATRLAGPSTSQGSGARDGCGSVDGDRSMHADSGRPLMSTLMRPTSDVIQFGGAITASPLP
jgi:hypothetical protein